MVSGPKGRAAWRIQDAQYHGLAQRRRRVLLVADFGRGADPVAVLFERVGMQGNPAPSREARKGFATDVAPSLVSSGRGVERTGDTRGQDPVVAVYAPEIARCVATREGSSQDYETTTMVAQTVFSIMPQNSGRDYKARVVDVAQPIMAGGPTCGNQGGDVVCVTGDITHTLKAEGADASEDGTGRGTPIVAHAFDARQSDVLQYGDVTGPMDTGIPGPSALVGSAVRRLTPTECERLQGFPDNYTNIPWRGKPTSPDGPRYKALGNSWAVPKFTWLGRRIAMHMPARIATTTREAA